MTVAHDDYNFADNICLNFFSKISANRVAQSLCDTATYCGKIRNWTVLSHFVVIYARTVAAYCFTILGDHRITGPPRSTIHIRFAFLKLAYFGDLKTFSVDFCIRYAECPPYSTSGLLDLLTQKVCHVFLQSQWKFPLTLKLVRLSVT